MLESALRARDFGHRKLLESRSKYEVMPTWLTGAW
jgi:hypothetical protein